MTKYGLLKTGSYNIGDEIQCIATTRFLPQVDVLVNREYTDLFKSDGRDKVKLIMNHWWLHQNKHFPPADSIDPLFVSFHLKHSLRTIKFLRGGVLEYFQAHEPIGCRDNGTAEFLKSNGIRAYFSGCLTTTLLPNPLLKHKYVDDYILCVDAPEVVVNAVRNRTDKK